MGNRRMGLARMEALLEAVDRDLNLANSTLTDCIITTSAACTFTGATVGVDLRPSTCGLTATTTNTTGAITAVAETLHINNFTGNAAQVVTLPAATVGVRVAWFLSLDLSGGTNTLIFDSAGSDAFAAGSIIQSGVSTFDTAGAAEAKITYTPTDDDNNYMGQGSIWYFWCTTAGKWNVHLDAKANPAGTGLLGAAAFGA
mgnify:CR=1 FL=1